MFNCDGDVFSSGIILVFFFLVQMAQCVCTGALEIQYLLFEISNILVGFGKFFLDKLTGVDFDFIFPYDLKYSKNYFFTHVSSLMHVLSIVGNCIHGNSQIRFRK